MASQTRRHLLYWAGLALILLAVGWAWTFVSHRKAVQAEHEEVLRTRARGRQWRATYRLALQTLVQQRTDHRTDEERLAGWLSERTRMKQPLSEVWEYGVGGLPEDRRGFDVLESVRLLEPVLIESLKSDFDASLPDVGVAIWVLDAFSLRDTDPAVVLAAARLRRRLVEALREARPNPLPVAEEEWVEITGGRFLMGSGSEPDWSPGEMSSLRHPVQVSTFRMLRHEVTNQEFAAFLENPTAGENHSAFYGKPDQPARYVSWYQAYSYAAWLGGRLPTEAEWEYAARSEGLDQRFPWGNETEDICERAVVGGFVVPGLRFPGNRRECGFSDSVPVCSLPRGHTRQGVCDLAGGVWEWVVDWLGSYPSGLQRDPWGPVEPPYAFYGERVVRGGDYKNYSFWAETFKRHSEQPEEVLPGQGFRVVIPSAETSGRVRA